MRTSKKIFIALSVVFFGLLVFASYDISRRTTFPGSKSQLKERIQKKLLATPPDSAARLKAAEADTAH
jgi:hypothetical protein